MRIRCGPGRRADRFGAIDRRWALGDRNNQQCAIHAAPRDSTSKRAGVQRTPALCRPHSINFVVLALSATLAGVLRPLRQLVAHRANVLVERRALLGRQDVPDLARTLVELLLTLREHRSTSSAIGTLACGDVSVLANRATAPAATQAATITIVLPASRGISALRDMTLLQCLELLFLRCAQRDALEQAACEFRAAAKPTLTAPALTTLADGAGIATLSATLHGALPIATRDRWLRICNDARAHEQCGADGSQTEIAKRVHRFVSTVYVQHRAREMRDQVTVYDGAMGESLSEIG